MKTKLFPLALLLFCLLSVVGCGTASTPTADVIVREEGETRYYALEKKPTAIDAFAGDPVLVYTAVDGCFDAYIEDDMVHNLLVDPRLYDADGNLLENDDTVLAILAQAEQLDHAIYFFQLIRDGDVDLVFLKMNVNLWIPCDLYYYDAVQDRLVLLYEFDDVDLLGVRLPEGFPAA